MKKIISFFIAAALVLCVALGCHFYTRSAAASPQAGLYGWTDETKYLSMRSLASSIDEYTIPVMGSSELQHQKSTPYNPANVFAGQKIKPMLIGAGYYQSLFHATALTALSPEMENKKAVLILAPQWFRKSGVRPEAFASRFSEENYLDMLQNEELSAETRLRIIERTHKLLKDTDPTMEERLTGYEKQYLDEDLNPVKSTPTLREKFVREKNRTNIYLRLAVHDLRRSRKWEEQTDTPDFEALRVQAAEDGEKSAGGNEFYVKQSYYDHYIVHVMDEEKDAGIRTGYSVSPEYEDFRTFLMTCRDLDIQPLVMLTPVNGYWYDYIGFPADAREDYYSQIRDMVKEFGAELCDFSDREYEKYFMEDTIHIGWKGWVDACEAIYGFAKE